MNIIQGQVTLLHIDAGGDKTCNCPVALALRDLGFETPEVFPSKFIARTKDGNHVSGWFDDIIKKAVWEYDEGLGMLPFSFEIDLRRATMQFRESL